AGVALRLEDEERFRHVDMLSHLAEGILEVPHAGAVESRLAEVEAEVEDDPDGPKSLAVEHAKPVRRVVEVAELRHEPFGVQRPALAVPGHEVLPAPRVEAVGLKDGLAVLEMMSGDALVVHGRALPPGVELR